MSTLQGAAALRSRLRAIRQAFKPIGRSWADETASIARVHAPVKTGHLKRSIRRKHAGQKRATVYADYWAVFAEKGTKAYDIGTKPGQVTKTRAGRKVLAFQVGGRTVFSRKVHKPRRVARPFIGPAAHEALRRHPMAAELIQLWNEAA